MSGARTMPNCGLTSAATTAKPTAASELPSMRKAMATSMTSAPTASVWPHSAESYQVTGLKQVERGRPERGAARIRPRPQPAADEAVQEVGDAQVGGDRRQLDQPADDRVGQRQDEPAEGDRAAAQQIGRAAADRAQDPQHVEVAGRVVGKAGVGVEAARAVLGQRQGPRGEAADVALEAGPREEDVCDDESQRQPDEEQDGDAGDDRGRPVRATRRRTTRSAPPAGALSTPTGLQQERRVARSIATARPVPQVAPKVGRGPPPSASGRVDPAWIGVGFFVVALAVYSPPIRRARTSTTTSCGRPTHTCTAASPSPTRS